MKTKNDLSMNSKHFSTSNTNEVCHFKPCQPCRFEHCEEAQTSLCHSERSEVSHNSKRVSSIASLPCNDKKLNRDISFSTKTRNDKNSNIDPSSFAKPQYDKGKKSLCRVSKNSHDKSPSLASEDSHDKSFCRADGQHIKPPSLAEGGLGGGYENLENSQSAQNSTNAFNSCYTETSCEESHNSKRVSSIASLPRSDKKLNRDISFSTKTRNDKNSKNKDPSSFSKPQYDSVKKPTKSSTKSKEFK